jgi:hypothetical protein
MILRCVRAVACAALFARTAFLFKMTALPNSSNPQHAWNAVRAHSTVRSRPSLLTQEPAAPPPRCSPPCGVQKNPLAIAAAAENDALKNKKLSNTKITEIERIRKSEDENY